MNVTPLVDVVLVLLIIFMVIAPQLEAGAAVDMPSANNPDPKSDVEYEPLTVSITRHGEIYLEKRRVTDLERELTAAHRAVPGRKVQLRGDRDVPYRVVRDVFRTCQEIGFPGIGLQVGEKADDEDDRDES